MEQQPKNPNTGLFRYYEDSRERARRERQRLIERSRARLGFIMALAHSAVELSLRREPARVRHVVRGDLRRMYGFRRPRLFGPIG